MGLRFEGQLEEVVQATVAEHTYTLVLNRALLPLSLRWETWAEQGKGWQEQGRKPELFALVGAEEGGQLTVHGSKDLHRAVTGGQQHTAARPAHRTEPFGGHPAPVNAFNPRNLWGRGFLLALRVGVQLALNLVVGGVSKDFAAVCAWACEFLHHHGLQKAMHKRVSRVRREHFSEASNSLTACRAAGRGAGLVRETDGDRLAAGALAHGEG
jgi:hypothetical protein